MKNIKKISAWILIGTSISSCTNLENGYCSKDCKTNISEVNVASDNDSSKSTKFVMIKNDSLRLRFNSEESLVCLLTGEEQVKRKLILQKEIFSQVKETKEINEGYIFYFEYEESFLMNVMDYVIAENNCCPFLTFELKLHSKNAVRLKITGSKMVKEMIKSTLIDQI